MESSLVCVNELVDTGKYQLLSNGALIDLDRGQQIYANGNWFSWHWWGYDAGLSHCSIEGINQVLGGGTAAIAGFLKYRGWSVAAAMPAGVYILIYLGWVNAVDVIGGRRGVTFTATWPNVYMPLVWYQR